VGGWIQFLTTNMTCKHEKLVNEFYQDRYVNDLRQDSRFIRDDEEASAFYKKWYHDKDSMKCPDCNKSLEEMFLDADDIDPTERTSEQPHGGCTLYCNACQMYVKPARWDGEEVCPYHQRVRQTEEGTVFMYEEFNQDGEEW